MKRIIGYTDSITECECCGKTELKGTYCIELDGIELYYGSTCAFKAHGLTTDEQKELKASFTKEQKNKKLYEVHIQPLMDEMNTRLKNGFTVEYNELTELAKKIYHQIESDFKSVMQHRAKRYKITI